MSMTTSEVLDLAADKIQQHGWTQFNGWNATPLWRESVDFGSDRGGSLCLEGGIMAAMGMSLGDDGVHADSILGCPAYNAVHDYLALPFHHRTFRWNDKPERTQAEVIEVLRAAAAVERVKEAAYSTEDEPLPLEVVA